jgi:glycosyltransferase involved in cell wall biosynthesis
VYTTDVNDKHSRITDYNTLNFKDSMNVHYFKNLSNSLAFKRLCLPKGFITASRNTLKTFDIIHLHDYRSFQNIVAHHYAKQFAIPYVIQAHGSLPRIMNSQQSKRIFDSLWGKNLLKDAAKVIALTPLEAEQYLSMGVKQENIEIVPNGIDLDEFRNLPPKGSFKKKWNMPGNQKFILFLARINKIKGVDLLARAFARISLNNPDLKLVIAGPDDGYLTELKSLLRHLQIEDKVLLLGPLYDEEKLGAYVDADVYVLPSIYETFPVSALESCSCGTPVLFTDCCGIADILGGHGGISVPFDEGLMGQALLDVLKKSTQERRAIGALGRSLVFDNFGWDIIAAKLEHIYIACKSS